MFMGEIKPQYGRWVWPYRAMQPGDYFIVDQALLGGEELRQRSGVRAAQLGITLSVTTRDPDNPGYTRVTRPDYANEPKPLGTVMEYGTAKQKLKVWYDYNLDGMPFSLLEVEGNKARVDKQQLKEPSVSALMFDHSKDSRTAVVFDKKGFDLYALSQSDTFEGWKPPVSLEDVMG